MCGSARTIRSPSIHSTSLKTPCVLGCCGPMFTIMSTVSACWVGCV